jgi:hypothetical protein
LSRIQPELPDVDLPDRLAFTRAWQVDLAAMFGKPLTDEDLAALFAESDRNLERVHKSLGNVKY